MLPPLLVYGKKDRGITIFQAESEKAVFRLDSAPTNGLKKHKNQTKKVNSTMKKLTTWSILPILFCLIFSQNAYAYLDPGSGSYILQLLLGVMFGLLFAIKIFWSRIKMFLVKIFSKTKQDEKSDE